MLELKNVTKKYKNTTALNNINLLLPDVGFIIIKGQNGSGKTTLLNLIGGMDSPTKGEIIIFDRVITNLPEKKLGKYREQYISVIPQDNELFDELTVEENIEILGKNEEYEQVIKELELKELLKKEIKSLSGGEQKRVAIARALMKKTKIILADEPTSSLDKKSKKIIYTLFKKISKKKLVIMITHDTNFPQGLASRIIELENGSIKHEKVIKRELKKNEESLYKDNFNLFKFTDSLYFKNKKKIKMSGFVFIVNFLLLLFIVSIASVTIDNLLIDTLYKENRPIQIQKIDEQENIENLTQEDINILKSSKIFSKAELGKTIEINNQRINFTTGYPDHKSTKYYYNNPIDNLYFFRAESLKKVDVGTLPKYRDEIVVTSYLGEYFIEHGMKTADGKLYKPTSMQSLVEENAKILLGNREVKVTGIVEVDYNIFKNSDIETPTLKSILNGMTETALANVFVTEDFYTSYEGMDPQIDESDEIYVKNSLEKGYTFERFSKEIMLLDGSTIDNLKEDEIIINQNMYTNICNIAYDDCIGKIFEIDIKTKSTKKTLGKFKIIGISNDDKIYFNKEVTKDYETSPISVNKIILQNYSKDMLKTLINDVKESKNYHVFTEYTEAYKLIEETVKEYTYILSIFLIFVEILTVIFLTNYILDSIDTHKKEIGFLKTFGISNIKIMATFLIESLLITCSTFMYATLIFIVTKFPIDYIAKNSLGFYMNLMPIEPSRILLILILAVLLNVLITGYCSFKIKKVLPKTMIKNYNL